MTVGPVWDGPFYRVRLGDAEVAFLPGAGEDLELIGNVDVRLADGSRWGATFFTPAAVERLMEAGESLGGRFFHCADGVLVRESGIPAMVDVVAGLVESGEIRSVFRRLDFRGALHHVELWVPDVTRSESTIGWLLKELGWVEYQRWPAGMSWRLGDTYVVVERSPDMESGPHERKRPGLNHLALHVGGVEAVDAVTVAAQEHGWVLMFADRHPYAGGPEHYAAYLEDEDGFEVELVATTGG